MTEELNPQENETVEEAAAEEIIEAVAEDIVVAAEAEAVIEEAVAEEIVEAAVVEDAAEAVAAEEAIEEAVAEGAISPEEAAEAEAVIEEAIAEEIVEAAVVEAAIEETEAEDIVAAAVVEELTEEAIAEELEAAAATVSTDDLTALTRRVEGPVIYTPREIRGRARRVGSDARLEDIHYKSIPLLTKFLDARGRILSRRKTRVSAKIQRRAAKAIKRARHLALLPYTGEHTRITRKHR